MTNEINQESKEMKRLLLTLTALFAMSLSMFANETVEDTPETVQLLGGDDYFWLNWRNEETVYTLYDDGVIEGGVFKPNEEVRDSKNNVYSDYVGGIRVSATGIYNAITFHNADGITGLKLYVSNYSVMNLQCSVSNDGETFTNLGEPATSTNNIIEFVVPLTEPYKYIRLTSSTTSYVQGVKMTVVKSEDTPEYPGNNGDDEEDDDEIPEPESCCFEVYGPTSDMVTTKGCTFSRNYSVTYDRITYRECVQFTSSSSEVRITPAFDCTMTLVFDNAIKNFYIDGVLCKTDANGIYSFDAISRETSYLVKRNSSGALNLFLVILTPKSYKVDDDVRYLKGNSRKGYYTDWDVDICDKEPFTSEVDFTAPSVTYYRELGTSTYGTIIMPFELKSDDNVQYYTVADVEFNGEEGRMHLTPLETVAACQPAIFKNLDGDTSLDIYDENVLIHVADNHAQSLDCSSGNWSFDGNINQQQYPILSSPEDGKYVYYIAQDKFWNANEEVNLPMQRACIFAEVEANSAKTLLRIDDQDTPTEINAVEREDGSVDIYLDLSGRRAPANAKGIMIQGGKKVIVK